MEPESLVPISDAPKGFRSLRPKLMGLTTVFVIEGRDELAMCADTQETGWVKEICSKIAPISFRGQDGLLGSAGSSEYIGLFEEYIQEALRKPLPKKKPTMLRILNSGMDAYTQYTEQRIENLKLSRYERNYEPEKYFPAAIFAYFDREVNSFRVFTTAPLKPWIEMKRVKRAAVGSGGDLATVLLKTAEDYMNAFDLNWRNFSPSTLFEFCYVLMDRVTKIDPYSSGFDFWRVTKDMGLLNLSEKDAKDYLEGGLATLLKHMADELPADKLKKIIESPKLKELLDSLVFA